MERFIWFLCVILLLSDLTLAQGPSQTTCPNSNFNTGTYANWAGCYGKFLTPCMVPGFNTTGPRPRHLIIAAPGFYDPYTSWCTGKESDSLISVFPGDTYSSRLGNSFVNDSAEELKYTISVTSETFLFVYRYAVVLEDPGHPPSDQPSFTIQITDSLGNLLDPICGYYYVYAQPNLPGWNTCIKNSHTIRWKNWSTVGLNLAPYLGNTVTITFITRDCHQGAHFGYAYISAFCSALMIQTFLCPGDSNAVLTAPPGFSHYLWSNGDSTQSTTIINPIVGFIYTCLLTAYNGCQVTISVILANTQVIPDFTFTPNCPGLPTQFHDNSTVNQNQIVSWKWEWGDGTQNTITTNPNPIHIFTSSGTFNVKMVAYSTEGCNDSIVKQVTNTPLPLLINTPLTKTICTGNNTSIDLLSNHPGTTFTWSASALYPTTTGYHNNLVPSVFLDDTIFNPLDITDTVNYIITPHDTLCEGNDTIYKVIVTPKPKLTNNILEKLICDSTLTNIILNYNVPGTQFTWTCTSNSPTLSGFFNSLIPDTIINQRLWNSGTSADTLFYNIIPHVNGCNGDTYIYMVKVFPRPDLSNIPLSKTICSNTSTNILLTSSLTGTLFTWSATGSSPAITGFADNLLIPDDSIDQNLVNAATSDQTVTYHITPHANGCTGNLYSFIVTVHPESHLTNNPLSKSQCNNLPTNIVLVPDVPGTLFTWTASGSSGNISGYSGNPVPTLMLNQVLVNSGLTTETVTYHISPEFSGCPGVQADYIVSVHPVADVYFTPASQTICSGSRTDISILSHVPFSSFVWIASGSSPNVTGYSSGSGNAIQQVLFNSGGINESVTYLVSASFNNCPGLSSSVTAEVRPPPYISFSLCRDTITTIDAQPVSLKGGIPPGGIYSGSGVVGNIFNPAVAGPGVKPIQYTYTNFFGCPRSVTRNITVVSAPPFTCGNNFQDVRDNKTYATVEIGSQCWMAANLNYGTYILFNLSQRDNCNPEKYCYSNDPAKCIGQGGLYQWDELMDYNGTESVKGICPPSWHVPSETEWNILFDNYSGPGFSGFPLKISGFSGFDALLAGAGFHNVKWDYTGFATFFWTSTAHGNYKAWAHATNTPDASMSTYPSSRSNSFYVRCVKNF